MPLRLCCCYAQEKMTPVVVVVTSQARHAIPGIPHPPQSCPQWHRANEQLRPDCRAAGVLSLLSQIVVVVRHHVCHTWPGDVHPCPDCCMLPGCHQCLPRSSCRRGAVIDVPIVVWSAPYLSPFVVASVVLGQQQVQPRPDCRMLPGCHHCLPKLLHHQGAIIVIPDCCALSL